MNFYQVDRQTDGQKATHRSPPCKMHRWAQPDECPDVICDNNCNGMAFKMDTRGCKTCQWMPHVCPVRNCPVCSEDTYWYSYDSNGCQTCTCVRNPPECPVLDCYCGGDEPAFVVDENLCPICICQNQLSDERYWDCLSFVLNID